MAILTIYPTQRHSLPSTTTKPLLRVSVPALFSTMAYLISDTLQVSLFTLNAMFRLLSTHLLLPMLFASMRGAKDGSKIAEREVRAVLKVGYKKIDKFWNDCFWHLMVWMLNPYAIWLFIFWPGWIVVGGLCRWVMG
ncbi:hypothetical protein MMC18_004401 [Xylographa bjoerkii]|nr:hypothetical protein [Xylographa bjoerkii]